MKNVTKLFSIFILIAFGGILFAQSVAINNDGSSADASAILDVKSTNKGFLPPRIALTGTTDASTISSPVAGLLIYNTSNTNDVTPGYYYYGGSSWVKIDAGLWSFDLEEDISTTYNVGIGTTTPGHKFTVAGQGGPNTALLALDITGTGDGWFNWASSAIAPNLPANYNLIHMIGQAESANNSGYIGFNYKENGSTANFLTFGLFAKDNIMNITGAGYVGIGTKTPADLLQVGNLIIGGDNNRVLYSTTDYDIMYKATGEASHSFFTNSVERLKIRSDGMVGIGTDSPLYTFYVNGTSGGTNAWNSSSDARLKKDVVNINNGLDKVMQLRPVTFNWKQAEFPKMNLDNKNHVGFIAQEVEEVVPQVVTTADDEMNTKSIAYSDLIPVLTKAIQEQQKIIEVQQRAFDQQQKKIDDQQKQIDKLEKLIKKKLK